MSAATYRTDIQTTAGWPNGTWNHTLYLDLVIRDIVNNLTYTLQGSLGMVSNSQEFSTEFEIKQVEAQMPWPRPFVDIMIAVAHEAPGAISGNFSKFVMDVRPRGYSDLSLVEQNTATTFSTNSVNTSEEKQTTPQPTGWNTQFVSRRTTLVPFTNFTNRCENIDWEPVPDLEPPDPGHEPDPKPEPDPELDLELIPIFCLASATNGLSRVEVHSVQEMHGTLFSQLWNHRVSCNLVIRDTVSKFTFDLSQIPEDMYPKTTLTEEAYFQWEVFHNIPGESVNPALSVELFISHLGVRIRIQGANYPGAPHFPVSFVATPGIPALQAGTNSAGTPTTTTVFPFANFTNRCE